MVLHARSTIQQVSPGVYRETGSCRLGCVWAGWSLDYRWWDMLRYISCHHKFLCSITLWQIVATMPRKVQVVCASVYRDLLEMERLVGLILIWMECQMMTWTVRIRNAKRITVLMFQILSSKTLTRMALVIGKRSI